MLQRIPTFKKGFLIQVSPARMKNMTMGLKIETKNQETCSWGDNKKCENLLMGLKMHRFKNNKKLNVLDPMATTN